MELNKKGIFFTSLVIVILSLFLVSFSFYSLAQERKVIQKRVQTMNSFLSSAEEDLDRQLYISGFRIIFLLGNRLVSFPGEPIDSFYNRANETFFNGTVYGETNVNINSIMSGATFNGIVQNLQSKADKINVDINLTNPVFEVYQEDPWRVKFVLTVNLSMSDKSGLASWNKTKEIIAYVPVEGFEDPIYNIYTLGTYPNIIKKTPFSSINSDNILMHINSSTSYYTNSTDAPSFIQRFEGNLSASPYGYGIESLIYTPDFPLSTNGYSIVDHQFFSDSPPQGTSRQGLDWLKIDDPHCAPSIGNGPYDIC